jgi:hypothetical protein
MQTETESQPAEQGADNYFGCRVFTANARQVRRSHVVCFRENQPSREKDIAGQVTEEYPDYMLNPIFPAVINFMKNKLTLWAALIGVALLTGCATRPIWERPNGKTEEEYLKDLRDCEEIASKQAVLSADELSDKARHNYLVGHCLKEKGYTPW